MSVYRSRHLFFFARSSLQQSKYMGKNPMTRVFSVYKGTEKMKTKAIKDIST